MTLFYMLTYIYCRDFYHDLDPVESKRWMYFEKFKMALHYCAVSTKTYTQLYIHYSYTRNSTHCSYLLNTDIIHMHALAGRFYCL